MDKKWLVGILTSVIIIPVCVANWKNIQSVWALPEKTQKIEAKVDEQEDATEQISKLVLEQKTRMDNQEMVNKLQVEALKEQLSLVAELKKHKK